MGQNTIVYADGWLYLQFYGRKGHVERMKFKAFPVIINLERGKRK